MNDVIFIDPVTQKYVTEKKKPIKINSKYFSNTTDMSYYDGILHYPRYHKANKGVRGKIVYISPDKYFEESAKTHFRDKGMEIISREMLREMANVEQSRTSKNYIDLYYNKTKESKMPIPVIDYVGHNQEGRHRAMVAKKLGLKKIPVLIVEEVK